MRVLTKSRFKLGLECPNKLYYTHKEEEYANTKSNNLNINQPCEKSNNT